MSFPNICLLCPHENLMLAQSTKHWFQLCLYKIFVYSHNASNRPRHGIHVSTADGVVQNATKITPTHYNKTRTNNRTS